MFWRIFVALCNEKGVSPNKAAADLGFSTGTVTWWKKGRIPRDTTIQRIADYFGVTPEYVMGEVDETLFTIETSVDTEKMQKQLYATMYQALLEKYGKETTQAFLLYAAKTLISNANAAAAEKKIMSNADQ